MIWSSASSTSGAASPSSCGRSTSSTPADLPEDPGTVERGLRRLRSRGTKPADKYGRLLLRAFSLPPSITRWARALGTYHGPLIDLPMALRREQLRLWDRAPLIESEHAAWVHLAQASLAHHDGELEQTDRRLHLARLGARRAGPAAEVELALFEARRCADRRERGRALEVLEACEGKLDAIVEDDAACFRARWLDQRAYLASRAWRREPEVLAVAESYLQRIPDVGAPFVPLPSPPRPRLGALASGARGRSGTR